MVISGEVSVITVIKNNNVSQEIIISGIRLSGCLGRIQWNTQEQINQTQAYVCLVHVWTENGLRNMSNMSFKIVRKYWRLISLNHHVRLLTPTILIHMTASTINTSINSTSTSTDSTSTISLVLIVLVLSVLNRQPPTIELF